jgi:hypothetical protein
MKLYYLLLLAVIALSCATPSKVVSEDKCPKIYKNSFTEIRNEKLKTLLNKDTVTFNEIRFECVFSAFYTHKIMYDKFGKWDKALFINNKKHPILVWENVDLFSDGKKYNVITDGLEEWKHIYASVMVFDYKENDLLSKDSIEKEKLINYFSNQIKKLNDRNQDFYEIYWKTVNSREKNTKQY